MITLRRIKNIITVTLKASKNKMMVTLRPSKICNDGHTESFKRFFKFLQIGLKQKDAKLSG